MLCCSSFLLSSFLFSVFSDQLLLQLLLQPKHSSTVVDADSGDNAEKSEASGSTVDLSSINPGGEVSSEVSSEASKADEVSLERVVSLVLLIDKLCF